jgi:transposase
MEKQAAGAQAAKPRSYTDEYRRQVVDMVVSTGRTAVSVAAELGIHHTLISRWMRRYGRTGGATAATSAPASSLPASSRPAAASPLKPVPVPHADQAAEVARLKREVEQLKMEREILKKGIAIFAAPSR